jgi:ATP-dependent Clp protease protease subunit
VRERLNKILSEHTGHSLDDISRDTDRDYFLSAQESQEYGLIDEVVARRHGSE